MQSIRLRIYWKDILPAHTIQVQVEHTCKHCDYRFIEMAILLHTYQQYIKQLNVLENYAITLFWKDNFTSHTLQVHRRVKHIYKQCD